MNHVFAPKSTRRVDVYTHDGHAVPQSKLSATPPDTNSLLEVDKIAEVDLGKISGTRVGARGCRSCRRPALCGASQRSGF
jgi:hypothetical protein